MLLSSRNATFIVMLCQLHPPPHSQVGIGAKCASEIQKFQAFPRKDSMVFIAFSCFPVFRQFHSEDATNIAFLLDAFRDASHANS